MSSKNQSTNKNKSTKRSSGKNRTRVVVILFAAGLVVLYLLFSQYLQRPNQVASGQPGEPAGQAAASAESEGPGVGMRAPDFSLRDLNGRKVALSRLQGKVVMLNFWAIWCPYCKAELPDIQRAYNSYRKQAGDVAMVLVDVGEPADQVKSFLKQKGYDLPVYLDVTSEVANLYLVRGIPASLFIDRNGIIRDIYTGAITEGEIKDRINAMLR